LNVTLFRASIHLDKLARFFAEFPRNQDLNPGEGNSPDNFSRSFRPAVAELTNRGNGKVCFMKAKTSPTTNSINCSPVRHAVLLGAAVAFAWFALPPTARAVSPPPDGGYPNRNTAEGDFALFSDDTEAGTDNTAIDFNALYSNISGSENTATGSRALYSNLGGIDNTATGIVALYSNTIGLEKYGHRC